MQRDGPPDYYKPANEALVSRLPELRAAYDEVTASWDEEMGPHLVYDEILNPYLTRLLESDDQASEADLRRVVGVLEELLVGDDAYAAAAVATTVGEYLESDRE